MPLQQGKSDETRSSNIAELIRSGKPRDQAAAIAYSVQRKAEDETPAAGVMFVTQDGQVLLMRRGPMAGDAHGAWAFPAGRAEDGETPIQTAMREAHEETGRKPNGRMRHIRATTAGNGFEFHTFAEPVEATFQPVITDEHDQAGWFPLSALPSPLHPGVMETLGTDLTPGETDGLKALLGKWLDEEAAEPEHAEDANQQQRDERGRWAVGARVKYRSMTGSVHKATVVDNEDQKDGRPVYGLKVHDPRGSTGEESWAYEHQLSHDPRPAEDARDYERDRVGRFSTGNSGKVSKEQQEAAHAEMKSMHRIKPEARFSEASSVHHNKHEVHTTSGTAENGDRYDFHMHGGWNGPLMGVTHKPNGGEEQHYRSGKFFPVPEEIKAKDAAPAEDAEFKEEQHPRDHGRFAKSPNPGSPTISGETVGPRGERLTHKAQAAYARNLVKGARGTARRHAEENVKRILKGAGEKSPSMHPRYYELLNAETAREEAAHPHLRGHEAWAKYHSDQEAAGKKFVDEDDAPAQDAFEEGKHPRGEGGKFAHHVAQAEHHENLARKHGSQSVHPLHKAAESAHRTAAAYHAPEMLKNHPEWAAEASKNAEEASARAHAVTKTSPAQDAAACACHKRDSKTGECLEPIALDRASARSFDKNGHLVVVRTPVTKAAVNEYYGREIPDAEALGLDPARRYRLLRHPDEIKKAAASWNGKPLLISHKPVSAEDHPKELVVGSVGTDSEFEAPYLYNSISVWDRDAIDAIESGRQKELSSAYHYTADMTPGVWEGQPYDGVMRDLHGNHVALVRDGRAGSDVVVQDSAPAPAWSFGAFDADFVEADHPRSEDGRFGAGRGKSHAAHAVHHYNKSEEHREAHAVTGSKAHEAARRAHADARAAHMVAERNKGESGKAHAASKSAYEASLKAGATRSDFEQAIGSVVSDPYRGPDLAKELAALKNPKNKKAVRETVEKYFSGAVAEEIAHAVGWATGANKITPDPAQDQINFGAFSMSKPAAKYAFDAFEEGKHKRDNGGRFAYHAGGFKVGEGSHESHGAAQAHAKKTYGERAYAESLEGGGAGAKLTKAQQNFVDHLDGTLIPDTKESGREFTAEDLETASHIIKTGELPKGFEHNDSVEEFVDYLEDTLIPDYEESGSYYADDFKEAVRHIKARTRKKPAQDSWEETKHPRANNGQFGAGAGKSHAEHQKHHESKAAGLRDQIARTKDMGAETATLKNRAADRHDDAANLHGKAHALRDKHPSLHDRKDAEQDAHTASKSAHEATQKASEHEMLRSYGAGSGKSHKEHSDYHLAKADVHMRDAGAHARPQPHLAAGHLQAAQAHIDAHSKHASAHTEEGKTDAFRASKAAHEASEKMKASALTKHGHVAGHESEHEHEKTGEKYVAGAEPSQFGGYRASIKHATKGHGSYSGQKSFDKPEAAHEEAKAVFHGHKAGFRF